MAATGGSEVVPGSVAGLAGVVGSASPGFSAVGGRERPGSGPAVSVRARAGAAADVSAEAGRSLRAAGAESDVKGFCSGWLLLFETGAFLGLEALV